MEEPEIIKGKPSEPDTKSWFEYIWKERQETPARLEDASKFLAGMISISLSIFLAIGEKDFKKYQSSCAIKTAVVLWLFSLMVSFFVLFPWRYRYVSESIQSIKAMHKKVILVKSVLLIISLILFLLALTILAVELLFGS